MSPPHTHPALTNPRLGRASNNSLRIKRLVVDQVEMRHGQSPKHKVSQSVLTVGRRTEDEQGDQFGHAHPVVELLTVVQRKTSG